MSHSLNVIKEDEQQPWYKNGLRFQCTGCGQCCTGAPGYIWVTEQEIAAIAQYLNYDLKTFTETYVIEVNGRLSLREHVSPYDCVFLKDKKCQIYPVRPKQCRTFPWWPRHLGSKQAWEEAARECEGINNNAPLVPFEVIREQLAIQEGRSDGTIQN
jgi:hypothetical protein